MADNTLQATDKKPEPEAGETHHRALLIGLLLAVTLHACAELAVITVLPVISRELDGSLLYGVAFSAYLITSLVSIVWSGHMTDLRGPSYSFVVGIVVFTLGLLMAAFSQSMWMFVIARAVQGLGGGAFSAVVNASVNRGWEDGERARIMAYLASAWVIPGLLAPSAAGAIAELWNWRVVFIVLLPITVIAALLSIKGLKAIGPGKEEATTLDKTIDAFRIALGITVFLAGITREIDLWSLPLMGAGLWLAWKPLGRILPRGSGPSRRILLASLGVKFLLMFGFFGAETFLPLGLIEVHGLSALTAGLVLTVASLSWTSAAFAQARFSSFVGPRTLATTGLVLVGLSVLVLLFLVDPDTPYGWAFALWMIAGGGIGLSYNTLMTSAMAHTERGKEGATSVAAGLVDGVAIAMVAGLGGAVLNQVERSGHAINYGIGINWALCAVVSLIGAAVAYFYLEKNVRKGTILSETQESSRASSQE